MFKFLKKINFNKKQHTIIFFAMVIVIFAILFLLSKYANKESFSNSPTLYFFFADWCPHCTKFKPAWNKFKESNNSNVQLKEEDCTNGVTSFAKQHNVKSFPTILYINGNNTVEFKGSRTESGLNSFLNELN